LDLNHVQYYIADWLGIYRLSIGVCGISYMHKVEAVKEFLICYRQ